MIRTVSATRYVTPLREGGSLPAIVDADDGEQYVMKFVGAGQGPKALIAELVTGEIGRALGLPVPEIVLIELDEALGPSEPDPEIYDLLRFSIGMNLGLRYLPKAFAYNPLLQPPPASDLASAIVWFDAYTTNVDRTPQNVNMLMWEHQLWLIDHGASLYFHHNWGDHLAQSRSPFPFIQRHTLLPFAASLRDADADLRLRLSTPLIEEIIAQIPAVWLDDSFETAGAHRHAYVEYLLSRLEASPCFVDEAEHARSKLL